MLTVVNLASGHKRVPYYVVATRGEAARWAVDRLADAGDPLPAERIRQHFGSSP